MDAFENVRQIVFGLEDRVVYIHTGQMLEDTEAIRVFFSSYDREQHLSERVVHKAVQEYCVNEFMNSLGVYQRMSELANSGNESNGVRMRYWNDGRWYSLSGDGEVQFSGLFQHVTGDWVIAESVGKRVSGKAAVKMRSFVERFTGKDCEYILAMAEDQVEPSMAGYNGGQRRLKSYLEDAKHNVVIFSHTVDEARQVGMNAVSRDGQKKVD